MTPEKVLADARRTLDQLREELLADRGDASHWTGTLSSSCLSTATAISALSLVYQATGRRAVGQAESDHEAASKDPFDLNLQSLIVGGVRYCLASQNGDGGFGDTDRSYSNIATSMLVAAALRLALPVFEQKGSLVKDHSGAGELGAGDLDELADGASLVRQVRECTQRLDHYIEVTGGIAALRQRYGKDKTFVIPILSNCALAGMVDWKQVQALPFELAAVPQSFYRFVRMPVVSYAIPALVAIGQARFFNHPPAFLPLRWLRRSVLRRTMQVLEKMQPDSGGYLEATPLTAFVLMSLAATGRAESQVAGQAVRFLQASVLADGSWPIDTNLATWITSLSIHALQCDPKDDASWADEPLAEWLLDCQHRRRHPFTGAEPGGWGWTDLSGAVPDGDDTPGAIIALAALSRSPKIGQALKTRMREAASAGIGWLFGLQNRDGGMPTFCRGWGKLPFDRSSTDLTAHALRAFAASRVLGIPSSQGLEIDRSIHKAWRFLRRWQRDDGSLLPLWFGNQDNVDDENPIYGTARALMAAGSLRGTNACDWKLLQRAADYLVSVQNEDGGWGGGPSRTAWTNLRAQMVSGDGLASCQANVERGKELEKNLPQAGLRIGSSVEETAVAVEGLAIFLKWKESVEAKETGKLPEEEWRTVASKRNLTASGNQDYRAAIIRGLDFLSDAVRRGKHQDPWPIGFYFAKLWYHERLYATVFSVAAIGTALSVFEPTPEPHIIERDPSVVDPHAVRL